jgi:hypothetical protein
MMNYSFVKERAELLAPFIYTLNISAFQAPNILCQNKFRQSVN